ncbi:MAG: ABC transporter ATP-binding protein [Coprobacillaceae bacterium]
MENKELFTVQNITFAYEEKPVLLDISLSIKEGKITTILGANGCGKSTLFHLLSKNRVPQQGEILLSGKSISNLNAKEFARDVAIVHQNNTAPDDIQVEKLVAYGRLPYKGFHFKLTSTDKEKIDWAMKVTDIDKYRNMLFNKLSGGQKQRVWIAMALAQDTKILLLDEPTTYLDIRYQIDILQLVRKLNKEFHMTIIMVLHDINQAIHYSDELVIMNRHGNILTTGDPNSSVTQSIIKETYGKDLPVMEVDNKKIVLTV